MTSASRTILLIEDNEQNRYLVTYLLEQYAYRVVSAVDGAHALELVRTLTPSLILLDIQLPSMVGYAVARELRLLENLQHTPIVAVTSYAMPGDREKALAAGCTGYIEKPIDPLTFVSQMESARPKSNANTP